MSKRIIMSIVFSAAMSIGGWIVTHGEDSKAGKMSVSVQLPANCSLLSPRDDVAAFGTEANVASVSPGMNKLSIGCDDKIVYVQKAIKTGDKSVTVWPDELK